MNSQYLENSDDSIEHFNYQTEHNRVPFGEELKRSSSPTHSFLNEASRAFLPNDIKEINKSNRYRASVPKAHATPASVQNEHATRAAVPNAHASNVPNAHASPVTVQNERANHYSVPSAYDNKDPGPDYNTETPRSANQAATSVSKREPDKLELVRTTQLLKGFKLEKLIIGKEEDWAKNLQDLLESIKMLHLLISPYWQAVPKS